MRTNHTWRHSGRDIGDAVTTRNRECLHRFGMGDKAPITVRFSGRGRLMSGSITHGVILAGSGARAAAIWPLPDLPPLPKTPRGHSRCCQFRFIGGFVRLVHNYNNILTGFWLDRYNVLSQIWKMTLLYGWWKNTQFQFFFFTKI